jgi:hypothetical protein
MPLQGYVIKSELSNVLLSQNMEVRAAKAESFAVWLPGKRPISQGTLIFATQGSLNFLAHGTLIYDEILSTSAIMDAIFCQINERCQTLLQRVGTEVENTSEELAFPPEVASESS